MKVLVTGVRWAYMEAKAAFVNIEGCVVCWALVDSMGWRVLESLNIFR